VRLFLLHTCVLSPTQTTSIRYLEPKSLLASSPSLATRTSPLKDDVPPPGTVKSVLPCTPLGVVKCLERIGVYNALLPYGDRAYGRTVTVINRCVPFPRSHHRDDQGPLPDRKSSDARWELSSRTMVRASSQSISTRYKSIQNGPLPPLPGRKEGKQQHRAARTTRATLYALCRPRSTLCGASRFRMLWFRPYRVLHIKSLRPP
jgi:hypothetical protein